MPLPTNGFPFGTNILIRAAEIFHQTALSYAFVNLKPILPGHVLVCPKRVVHRFSELTGEEVGDLFLVAQKVGVVVEGVFKGEALTIALQDGEEAGQTIKLQHWSKVDDASRKPRTPQQMEEEAAMLRQYFEATQ